MNDFDLRKYLAEGRLLKEELTWFIDDENSDVRYENDAYLKEVGDKIKELHPDISDEDLNEIIFRTGEQYSREEDFHGDSIPSNHFADAAIEIYQTDILAEGRLLKENINMATILSHDDYHDLYIGNRAEHDAMDREEQFSSEYMINLDPGMYQMIYWDNDGPDHMSFDNKLDYVQKSIMNFWGEDHFIEKFGIEDEVGDDNWDYFDQHVADNLDMYYEELNNLINNSYPDGDSASGVVLLVNGKIVAGKAYKI